MSLSVEDGDVCGSSPFHRSDDFNPHRPRRVATCASPRAVTSQKPFQSTPSAEDGDSVRFGIRQSMDAFQSTPPVEGGDGSGTTLLACEQAFQSTPPVEGGDVSNHSSLHR